MNENGNLINSLFERILFDYFDTFNYDQLNVQFIITENIWKIYYEMRPDLRDEKCGDLPDYHGTIVPPLELDGKFSVLIDQQYLVEDMQKGLYTWVGTIVTVKKSHIESLI